MQKFTDTEGNTAAPQEEILISTHKYKHILFPTQYTFTPWSTHVSLSASTQQYISDMTAGGYHVFLRPSPQKFWVNCYTVERRLSELIGTEEVRLINSFG